MTGIRLHLPGKGEFPLPRLGKGKECANAHVVLEFALNGLFRIDLRYPRRPRVWYG